MKKANLLISVLVCLQCIIMANDTLDINNVRSSTAYPNKFTGVSSMSMYECIDTLFQNTTHTYKAEIIDTIYNFIKPLQLNVLRFPGGTIGNYYHFYGKGHGIDTSETTCAAGRIGNVSFANMHLEFDKKADKNMIEYFKEEVDTLKKYGNDIGVCYRINSHTHIYRGQLKQYSDTIQFLINKYLSSFASILNTNGDLLDSAKINAIVPKLMLLQSDSIYKQIKRELISNPSFYYYFRENLNAVEYLRMNGVQILGAEIGNETYAEYIVFDDDLKYIGFDCTSAPDSFHYNLWQLPLKFYLEGMLKNNLLVSLYADSLKTKYNIVSAVPANSGINNVSLDNQYYPIHVKPYDLSVKKSDLWNKYFASQSNVFAMIPHIYSQDFLSCSDYLNADSIFGLDKTSINKIAERFYTYFIDTLLIYNLKRFNYYSNNKPLWITEWNFTESGFATNTFLHAFYNYYFIRKMLDVHDFSPNYVQILLYHHLVGQSYTWPLIRTYQSNHTFIAQRQITYSPFYIWSTTMHQQVKRLKTNFENENSHTIIDVFIDSSQQELIVQFVNTDSIAHFINLNSIYLSDNNKELTAKKINRYLLDAASILSTNYSRCAFYSNPNYATQYQISEDTLTQLDTLYLPAISMGKFSIQLKNKINTSTPNIHKPSYFSVFPNPASNQILVQFQPKVSQYPYDYTIYDSTGRSVLKGKIYTDKTAIDISSLSNSWYQIQISDNNQLIDYKQFVKN